MEKGPRYFTAFLWNFWWSGVGVMDTGVPRIPGSVGRNRPSREGERGDVQDLHLQGAQAGAPSASVLTLRSSPSWTPSSSASSRGLPGLPRQGEGCDPGKPDARFPGSPDPGDDPLSVTRALPAREGGVTPKALPSSGYVAVQRLPRGWRRSAATPGRCGVHASRQEGLKTAQQRVPATRRATR